MEKLLKDELKVRSNHKLVQSQLFSGKLKKTLNAYHNRAISTMEVIEELIKLAKEMEVGGQERAVLVITNEGRGQTNPLVCISEILPCKRQFLEDTATLPTGRKFKFSFAAAA